MEAMKGPCGKEVVETPNSCPFQVKWQARPLPLLAKALHSLICHPRQRQNVIALEAPESGYTTLKFLQPPPFSKVTPVSVSGRIQLKEKESQACVGTAP